MVPIYEDFELMIQGSGDTFVVQLVNSPAGQASGEFHYPFTQVELGNFYSRIGQPRRNMRRIDAPDAQAAKSFGGQLFKAVFTGDILSQLHASINLCRGRNHGLRLRLRLKGAPTLAEMPWEFLYDAEQNQFLATSSGTPVVRFLDLPYAVSPLRVHLPIRVLVILAGPRNLPCLDAEGEWDRLNLSLAVLKDKGILSLERISSATLEALRKRTRGEPFHVLHFIGHGGFDSNVGDGVLQFEDAKAMSSPVSGQFLGSVLRDHASLRLAILNACEGARQSKEDPFSGVAQSLCQQHLPAVVAMQFEISDDAAKTFAEEFYGAIADGYPVDAAVSEARKALYTGSFGQEWATPVLYMRSSNGVLFDFPRRIKPTPDKAALPDPPAKPKPASEPLPVQQESAVEIPRSDPIPPQQPIIQKPLGPIAGAAVETQPPVYVPPAQPQPPAPIPFPSLSRQKSRSHRTLFIMLGIVFGAIALSIAVAVFTYSNSTPQSQSPDTTKPNLPAASPSPSPSPPATEPAQPAAATPNPSAEINAWVEKFEEAFQGPSPEGLRPFYADSVSPYFNIPSANWADIQKDKEAYFNRYPQIHYSVVGDPEVSTDANGDTVVDVTVAYDEVNKNGRSATGQSHQEMTLRNIDGSLKIVGIKELQLR